MTLLMIKEMAAMRMIGMVISQTLTSCLIHLPLIQPSHHLKASTPQPKHSRTTTRSMTEQ